MSRLMSNTIEVDIVDHTPIVLLAESRFLAAGYKGGIGPAAIFFDADVVNSIPPSSFRRSPVSSPRGAFMTHHSAALLSGAFWPVFSSSASGWATTPHGGRVTAAVQFSSRRSSRLVIENTFSNELWTFKSPLYSTKPSLRNRFMK